MDARASADLDDPAEVLVRPELVLNQRVAAAQHPAGEAGTVVRLLVAADSSADHNDFESPDDIDPPSGVAVPCHRLIPLTTEPI